MNLLQKILIFITVTAFFGILTLGITEVLSSFFNWDIRDSQTDINVVKLVLLINHLISFIASSILLAYIFEKKKYSDYVKWNKNIRITLLFKFFLLLIMIYPIGGLIAQVISLADLPEWAKSFEAGSTEIIKRFLEMSHPIDFFANILVMAVVPGIGEEMLFRGVLQNELQKHIKNGFTAIWIAAFFFSLIHLDVSGFIAKFLIGCVLGLSFYLTKNLVYSILLHFINNAVLVFIALMHNDKIDESEITNMPINKSIIALALLTIPLIFIIFKNIKEEINLEYGSGT